MEVLNSYFYLVLFISFILNSYQLEREYDEQHGVLYANTCEVCKYLAIELELKLQQTGKTHEVLELGYEMDRSKRKKQTYRKSELRLLESMDGICEKMLDYKIHKERKDSTRIDKDMSQTFKTLHGLVEKGVNVELGIPYELWDKPSAEITDLKAKCENLLENYEDDISEWYYNHQDVSLKDYLCSGRVLRKGDDDCLQESEAGVNKEQEENKSTKTKTKKSKTEL